MPDGNVGDQLRRKWHVDDFVDPPPGPMWTIVCWYTHGRGINSNRIEGPDAEEENSASANEKGRSSVPLVKHARRNTERMSGTTPFALQGHERLARHDRLQEGPRSPRTSSGPAWRPRTDQQQGALVAPREQRREQGPDPEGPKVSNPKGQALRAIIER